MVLTKSVCSHFKVKDKHTLVESRVTPGDTAAPRSAKTCALGAQPEEASALARSGGRFLKTRP